MQENAPMACYCIPRTTEVTWDPNEFIPASQWLEQERSAAQAEAERPQKGHAADQPQAQV